MKKQTCFLVGGIITSISNHTNQCVIVIMVTALKANFKGGRVVAEYRQEVYTGYSGTASIMLRMKVWKE